MIFDQARHSPESQDRSAERRALVGHLIGVFEAGFPEVGFHVVDRVSVVNAQASISGDVRSVHLFGGLAYHPEIGHDGLVYVLLHETGHHLGAGCRMPWKNELACDCAADFWAVTEGRATLAKHDCEFVVATALRQIERAAGLKRAAPAKARRSSCSFLNWNKRKQRLVRAEPNLRESCAII